MKSETRKPTILVVDDDEPTRASMRAMLEPVGYNVIEATDGEAGLNLYRQEQVDLVVMDILMPGKEGIETIRELKEEFPEVKIIAISGSGIEYLFMAKEFGASYTLLKPLHKDEFVAVVKELLDAP